tara:strand:+ start:5681 stop:7444 length:1764 start_codon:yes stop_codon:yes gene_type:complete
MALSYVTFTGNGSSTGPITLGFNYILKSHVKVYQTRDILADTGTLLSETTHYTWNGAGTQITMVTAPANGVVITIERQTPNDEQIVPYSDGSNLIADSLNNSDKQTLFTTQELEDKQTLSAAKADAAKTASDTATDDVADLTANYFKRDGSLAMTGALQMGTKKITGMGDPVSAQDAVTKAYLERAGSIASAQILDGTIVDGDINASAAIAGSKLVAASGSAAGSMSSAHFTKVEGIEASAKDDQTGAEIKSLYEGESDTNAFTDAEKTKLSGVESNATADQSASEIKSAYESNSDTNAFTDADHTKLDGIASGAEVNVQPDWNASSGDGQIANKPTIPGGINDLSDVDTSGVADGKILKYQASSSKFIIADDGGGGGGGGGGTTNLSNTANGTSLTVESSTGTDTALPAATTSAWGVMTDEDKTKLDGIEASATADQTGSEIKTAYEGEADTNAYTDAEKTKLAGIATGAEVNVQSDWDASSGDAQILNKPTIPAASPTTTRGDIIYRGASADERLAKGASGKVLKMGANDPEWGDVGGAVANGCLYENSQTISDNYTIASGKGAHAVGPLSINAELTVSGILVIS